MPDLPPTVDPNEPDGTGRYEGSATSLGFSTSDDITPGTLIAGKYKLLEAIGEGGMGAVWMAQQVEPVKRTVAVKLIRAGMDSKTVLARFEAERQALSMMDHPNIARVLDVGALPNGRPFFVMELVKGTPITDFCDQRKLTPRQRLELFVPVCLAIQHAHQKGIIHRDIKPSNVLVALHDDKPVPKVIDFGVAKATGFTLTEKTLHTGFEQVVGTPVYMSPEQATFNQLDIDTRSDVYSLGVLLYELLTGTTPIERQRFKKAALLEMLRVVREEEPPRPSTRLSSTETKASIAEKRGTEPGRLTKELRTELDWVVMKSLEKDRTRRYSTAVNFAEDVQRYLAGEAVQAHPPSTTYRLRKFMQKHRGPVAAASAIVLGLIGGAVGTVYGVIKGDGEREARSLRLVAEKARDEAEFARDGEGNARRVTEKALDGERASRTIAEQALMGEKLALDRLQKANAEVTYLTYVRAVEIAYREYQGLNVVRARELLESCPAEYRGWEWRFVHSLCNNELAVLRGHEDEVRKASFSHDGSRVVTTSWDRTARIWDTKTGKEIVALKGHEGIILSAQFSGDGRRVVTTSFDRSARIWDAETGKELTLMTGHVDEVTSASFSSNHDRVVTASRDRTARVWDAGSGKELACLTGHTFGVVSAEFSQDDRRVLTISDDKTTRVWDAESGLELARLTGRIHSGLFESSRGGNRVVTLSSGVTARVWDSSTGEELATLKGHTRQIRMASVSRDGRRVVTASEDHKARVWGAETGKEISTLTGHTGIVYSASFSSDGSRVVTASQDRTARVWDVASGEEIVRLTGHSGDVYFASFSGDGRFVVTASSDRTARIWDTESGKRLDLTTVAPVSSAQASFSEDGRQLFIGRLLKWDDASRSFVSGEMRNLRDVRSAWFLEQGRTIVTTSRIGIGLCLWDADTGVQMHSLNEPSNSVLAVSSAGSGRLRTVSSTPAVKTWDIESGKAEKVIRLLAAEIHLASFSSDGRRIVTASSEEARVWDAATGKELARLSGHTRQINSASFSRSGQRIVTASRDGTLRVWDPGTGMCLALLSGHSNEVLSSSFSGDGRRVVSASRDRTVRVWDTETGTLLLTLPGHTGPVFLASFSDDDSTVRTVGNNSSDPTQINSLRVILYDTRPARETFRWHYEAPPPRAKP